MYQNYGRLTAIDDMAWFAMGAVSASANADFITFRIPSTAKMIMIYCIGGGAGGGGGGASAAGVAGSGGKGGGQGNTCAVCLPTIILPSTLYLQCGNGGPGGAGQIQGGSAGVAGSPGSISYVGITPSITTPVNLVNTSGITPSQGGFAASGATAGTSGGSNETTGGFGGLIGAMGAGRFASCGNLAGNGGAPVPAAATIFSPGVLSNNPFATPGAGGGGTNAGTTTTQGGSIIGAGMFPTLNSPAAAGSRGVDGLNWVGQFNLGTNFLPVSTGGTGGTSNTSTLTGGRGGDGGPGSGGGGGGGTNGAASIGGAGGNGGPGFIIIRCW